MLIKAVVMFGVSFAASLVIYPRLIPFLRRIKYGQAISEYSLDDYRKKEGTPTLGGIVFLLLPVGLLLVLDPGFIRDAKLSLVVMAYLSYGLIGFIDDYLIIVRHDNAGMKAWVKFMLQLVLSVVFYLIYRQYSVNTVYIPFFDVDIELGAAYAFLVFFMFTGSSNAVNLTDGMDGLAAGCSIFALIPFVLFAYNQDAYYLSIFVLGVVGALFGYLHYNVHPAKIFMGDVGSLALGGLLAALALVLKQEVALIFVGGVFVYETLCVIIQITSVKLRHKKVFRYTPIHYSFVLKGMSEAGVVKMFWLIASGCMCLGLLIGVLG